jgi:hypothetical protein
MIEEDVYEKKTKNILEAKDKILNQYNLMAVLSEYCKINYGSHQKKNKTILPEQNFKSRSYLRRIKPFLFGK